MSSTRSVPQGPPMVASGSRVVLLVSKGPSQVPPGAFVEVPPVTGRSQGDALSALQSTGLPVQVVNDYSEKMRRGAVIGQLPPAGASVSAGSQAVLLVSSGAPRSATSPVVLPDATGMSEAEAVALVQSAGLSPQLVHEHSRSVPAGEVITQLPSRASLAVAGGSRIKPWMLVAAGAAVVAIIVALVLLFSSGSVSVPDVAGMTQAEAEAAVQAAGLSVGSVEGTETADTPVGTVVAQDPQGGTEARKGSRVNLLVAGGVAQVQVPDVKGKNQAEATAELEAAGFQAKVTRRPDVFVEKGLVIEQDPVGGAPVDPGSVVMIAISEGPQPAEVEMPDVVGLTRVDAERALRQVGLAISVAQAASADEAVDVVMSQLPKAGEKLIEGSRVGIVVSSGPPSAEAIAVPNVVGATLSNAEQTLADAGFEPVPAASSGTGKPANQVIAQVPSAGTQAQPGSSVVIFYASGQ